MSRKSNIEIIVMKLRKVGYKPSTITNVITNYKMLKKYIPEVFSVVDEQEAIKLIENKLLEKGYNVSTVAQVKKSYKRLREYVPELFKYKKVDNEQLKKKIDKIINELEQLKNML